MILFPTVDEKMDLNRSRRLNFDAPFLSTKRLVNQGRLQGQVPEASGSNGVPFCWEITPGMPKNLNLLRQDDSETETPRLKVPPGRVKVHVNGENNIDVNESSTPGRLSCLKQQDVDVLSLTQAIDIVEHRKTSPVCSVSECDDQNSSDSNGYLTIETTEQSEDMSPNYIIERFLPDAAALAVVTSAASERKRKNKLSYLRSGEIMKSAVQKGCGLHMLLPWSTKHRICGFKNAFSPCSHVDLQPKFITKDK